jgi:hypothetical protein
MRKRTLDLPSHLYALKARWEAMLARDTNLVVV